jgi:hypothetical protein
MPGSRGERPVDEAASDSRHQLCAATAAQVRGRRRRIQGTQSYAHFVDRYQAGALAAPGCPGWSSLAWRYRPRRRLRNYPKTGQLLMRLWRLCHPLPCDTAAGTSAARRPVGPVPGSSRPSSHNGPGCHGISTATRASAPPPNAAACAGRDAAGPEGCCPMAGCGRCTRPPRPPRARSGCRTRRPGSCAARPLQGRAARPRWPRSSPPAACSLARWPRRSPPPAGHPRRR